MKKALIFMADGFEEIEAITVIDYLRRAGIDAKTVAVPSQNEDCGNIPNGAHNITVVTDLNFQEFLENFKTDLPDLIYLPGGIPGAPNLAACKEITDYIVKMFESGKIVSALCASPAVVLAKTGILKNKKWTCYPDMEKNLPEYCGSEEAAENLTRGSTHLKTEPFVTDGNLITGRGPGCTEQFAMELVKILTDEETMNKIKKASIQR